MFLIYHVTCREFMFKSLCEFMGTNHLTMFSSHWFIASADIKY